LVVGVAMSLGAYFWMGRVGRVPEIPRIFTRVSASSEITVKSGAGLR